MAVEIHVGLVGRAGLTSEIYRQLREAILAGTLRPGDQLPPTRDLAERLHVARTTVTTVYERLAAEGYVTPRTGSGTFVSAHRIARPAPAPRPAGALRPRPRWASVRIPRRLTSAPQYDLRPCMPDVTRFPQDTWRRLVAQQLRGPPPAEYGDPGGDPGLRAAIARHIGVARAVATSPADVIVTTGTQQAVDVMARVLLAPGDHVAVEQPGYWAPRQAFEAHGAHVARVPVDAEGIVVDAIPDDVRLVYVTPSHQFPLGMTMSLPRRVALLEWAAAHDAAIIEDDYDSEFRLGGRPVEPLHALCTDGRVIYVGSFSKSMFPTLRLGFAVVPGSLRPATLAAKYVSDWHSPLEPQRALADFLDGGHFARHVRRMRAVYTARHERLMTILADDFADRLKVIPATVGLHVAAIAPEMTIEATRRVQRLALEDGVAVGTIPAGDRNDHAPAGFLLGYGAIQLEQIDDGLARFRRCLNSRPR